MTFYAHLVLLVAENALDASAVLRKELHKRKARQKLLSVVSQQVQKRASVDIVHFFLFNTSMPVKNWVLFRVQIGSLKQTYSVCPATYNVL